MVDWLQELRVNEVAMDVPGEQREREQAAPSADAPRQ